jgi:hypothetical protein
MLRYFQVALKRSEGLKAFDKGDINFPARELSSIKRQLL